MKKPFRVYFSNICIIFTIFNCLFMLSAQESEVKKDDRIDVLQYGIDSEVISLIDNLKSQGDHTLDKNVLELLETTSNPDLRISAMNLLVKSEQIDPIPAARKVLESYPVSESLIVAAINVLTELESSEDAGLISDYLRNENAVVAVKAMEGIGKIGNAEYTTLVKEIYEDEDTPQSVKASALSTLGLLKDYESIDFLVDILEDSTQEKSYRWRACQALGHYADPEVLPHIRKALHDEDTILRTYAIRSLREFPADLVLDDLKEALRDSFWRVRVAAIETLGEREEKEAAEILIYKARRDPEEKIRLSAIAALGKIGGGKVFDALREIAESPSYSMAMRISALQVAIENDIASSFGMIDKIIEQEWDKDKSRLFIELVKAMTRQEHQKLAGYYEKFLTYNDVSVVLMTLKGIEKNTFFNLKDNVKEMSESKTASSIKTMAEQVLESL